MQVYRLAKGTYAKDLSGYGSLMVPGRWNFKGHRILYTAENSSLALLEYLAHTEGLARRLPYQLITISTPNITPQEILLNDLPEGWEKDVLLTRERGTQWIKSRTSLMLKVPSVINMDNCNILINPEHPDFQNIKIINVKEIIFDQRL